jgi:hypothetical protein
VAGDELEAKLVDRRAFGELDLVFRSSELGRGGGEGQDAHTHQRILSADSAATGRAIGSRCDLQVAARDPSV